MEVQEIDGELMIVELAGVIDAKEIEPLEAQLENQIKTHQTVKLLVDGRNLTADIAGLRAQFLFVEKHHRSIAKLALVVGDYWQQLAGNLADLSIGSDMRVFEPGEFDSAAVWIRS